MGESEGTQSALDMLFVNNFTSLCSQSYATAVSFSANYVTLFDVTVRSKFHWILYLSTVVDCSSPPLLDNGEAVFNSTVFGAVATYSCDEGYQLATPANQQTCLNSGDWSKEVIRCEAGRALIHRCTCII